jgi:AmmeMemoRadiSam system protein B
MMAVVDRPRLLPHLSVTPAGRQGGFVVCDPLQVAEIQLRVTGVEVACLRLFDGRRTLANIHAALSRGSMPQVSLEVLERLVEQLDEALLLDGPRYRARYREVAAVPVRPPACLGTYPANPAALERSIERLFTGPGGSGLPDCQQPDSAFRGVLAPHIDYTRGGASYTWAFRELFERTAASLFVIIGTSHYSRDRFILTRKNFATPLGTVTTDQRCIDRLVAHYGEGLFEDELHAHLPEHSIELEVVFLQYLYRDRPIRIVPLLVGSFFDRVLDRSQPRQADDIGRMIAALRALEAEVDEPICWIISGDLAHIGPKFGDRRPVDELQLTHSRWRDEALVSRCETCDMAGYFDAIAAEGDSRRICGLPPTYTTLEAVRPSSGRLLHYQQWADAWGQQSVSFASMAFYR